MELQKFYETYFPFWNKLAEADEYGISPGKYRIISEIIENHPTHTVEDLKDKSMAELKDMLTNGIRKDNGKGRK